MYKLALILALVVPAAFGESHGDDRLTSTAVMPDSFKDLEQVTQARSHEQALQTAAKEQQFVDSFNKLAGALEEFARTYKVTHTVDAKQVKSIREAYRKLERADPWFRPE